VFDPLLAGPLALGGPVPLQYWKRDGGLFERVAFGADPVWSTVLGAWVIAQGPQLVFADDSAGTQPWLAGEEPERKRRIELEAQLAALRGWQR
jgi:hypothetical protein